MLIDTNLRFQTILLLNENHTETDLPHYSLHNSQHRVLAARRHWCYRLKPSYSVRLYRQPHTAYTALPPSAAEPRCRARVSLPSADMDTVGERNTPRPVPTRDRTRIRPRGRARSDDCRSMYDG